MAKFATVDEYIAAIPEPLRDVATAARRAVDAGLPEALAAIRWAHPTWSRRQTPSLLPQDRISAHHLRVLARRIDRRPKRPL